MTIQPGKPEILGGNRKGGFPRIRVWRDGTIIVGGSAGRHERINGAQLMKLYDYFKRGKSLSQEALSREGFDDINLGGGYWALQSEDGGKTWADVKSDLLRILSGCSSGNLMELSDGTRLGTYTFMINTVKGSDKGQEMIVFRSKDKGATWQTEFAPVTGPAQCDPYWGDGHLAGTFYNSMLELPDGALLVFGISWFKSDTRYRTVVYRSEDQGRSFRYLSTVASDKFLAIPDLPFSLCEPGTVRLKSGEILCFMRSVEYEPIYRSVSMDDGKTWQKPERAGVSGILPNPVLLNNGVLAMSYGRPGVWVSFSGDGRGDWWTTTKCIWIWNSLWGEGHLPKTPHYSTPGYHTFERSDCNADMREIAPNRLMIVYNAPTKPDSKEPIDRHVGSDDSSVWVVTLEVGR